MHVRRVVGHSDIMDAPRRREMGPPRMTDGRRDLDLASSSDVS